MRYRRIRVLVVVLGVLVGAALSSGFVAVGGGHASIGTGIVIVDTNLAYQNGAAAGTGIVLTSKGEVLTNNHVIDGATSVHVVVPGTMRSYVASVVGYDRTADVAVLRLKGASGLRTAPLGDSSHIAIGQAVQAVGNAGGTGSLTTVRGSVTALRQSITATDDSGIPEQLTGLIETSAPLQPGDSGGPLVNGSGRVVGMDTAASEGFGFAAAGGAAYAIPIDTAVSVSRRIVAGKASATVHVGATPFLGVEVSSPGNGGYGSYGGEPGAEIVGVLPGGPAARAGLQVYDVITAVAGRTVTTPAAITSLLLTKKPGAKIPVAFVDQSGQSHTVTVTLGSGPPQ